VALRLLHYADLERAHDDPERLGRLAGLLVELRDEETVVTGGGDDTGPGVLSVVTEGRGSLAFFRAVDPDVETFGNHDFDHGHDPLLDVVAAFPGTWLCANAHVGGACVVWDDAAGELREARVGGDLVDPAATYEPATTEFFVAHDGLFPKFGESDVVDTHGWQYEAVVDYLRAHGLDPELERRISRSTLDPADVPERDWPHSP
jgi:2',3'-cyclic-nucleotide 2'-phosphodiesterase (5'-nucleotidase family)